MIFLNDVLNSVFYDPGMHPDIINHKYSRIDLCNTLANFSKNFEEDGYLEVNIGSTVKRVELSQVKESVTHRTADEIKNIIFYKPEFKTKIGLLGVEEPLDKEDSYNYACYLQLCYFFYLMDNFIFPDVHFFDLFKEKKWSAENVSDAGTGNEIYQNFIMSSIFNDDYYRRIDAEYEESFDKFQDAFFSWYELQTYKFTKKNNLEVPGKQSRIPEQFISEFEEFINEEINKISCILKDQVDNLNFNQTPFDKLLGGIKRYEALATQKDYFENLKLIDLDNAIELAELVKARLPEEFDSIIINKDDIEQLMEDRDFLSCVVGKDKLTRKDLDRIYESDLPGALLSIWDYEEAQLERAYNEGSFTFIARDDEGNYAMTLENALLISITRLHLPKTVKYFSNRTYLKNRSDGIKAKLHSLRLSFNAINAGGFKAKKSALRDSVFRILCRTVLVIATYGLEEFLYFELPMNKTIGSFERLPEDFPVLEQRTTWFNGAASIMESQSKDAYEYINNQ
ncbi:MAG: hypothetical protein Q4B60_05410 [Erysipelotrichaceae bacterium]|nr:hypothetical protein [Erysipelotrichaceae bacterium]